MKTPVAVTLAAVVLVAGVLWLAPTASGQGRSRAVPPGVAMRAGPGGELGVSVRELTGDEMSRARMEQAGGVFVETVREGSPAARGGLRSGDIIASFDGERVRGVRHFSRLVLETPPGRTVKGGIIRDGTRQTVDLTPEAGSRLSAILPDIGLEIERGLRSLPRDFDFDAYLPQRMLRAPLGMTLTPLTDQLASYFGVKEGVLVSAVETGLPAARAGIRAGDVLTAINGRPLARSADVAASLRDAAPGSTIEIRLVRDRKEMTVKAMVPDRQPVARDRTIPI
jgi:S1-C subfamily serine protease